MNRLLIEAEELIAALEYYGEGEYFLDLQTGEVLLVADGSIAESDDELATQIEAESDRYRAIEPIASSAGWEAMAEFIEQLPAGDARVRLIGALQHSHPFRRFKDTLIDYPKVQEQWFAFHQKALVQLAREWLNDQEIEADLKVGVRSEA